MRKGERAAVAVGLAWLLLGTSGVGAQLLASGDVTDNGAVLWAQVDSPGVYAFEVAETADFATVTARASVTANADVGLTPQAAVTGLQPATRYHYRIVGSQGPLPARGAFSTAPAAADQASLTLLFGADLGGQGYGRLRADAGLPLDGWPIFHAMSAERADLFLALGDMIYSDRPVTTAAPDYPKGNALQIPKPGPGYVANLDDFRRDWHYHRSDHRYARFLENTPIVATWDDHELVNDSGGPELVDGPTREELERDPQLLASDPSRPRNADRQRQSVFHNPELFHAGRRAMYEYNPISRLPDPSGRFDRRLYRQLRWGAHAEIIVLDTRSYRDPRYRRDSDDRPKTMLGAAQKAWLKERLSGSDATWKLVVSSVPLSIATGNVRDPEGRTYRDGWSNGGEDNPYGYERELREIADHVVRHDIRNVLFLTADQHHSNLIAYDPDGDGRVDFHEANVGPLRAGLGGGTIDRSLNPAVLFSDSGKASFAYGRLAIDGRTGRLTAEIRDVGGRVVTGARLELAPR